MISFQMYLLINVKRISVARFNFSLNFPCFCEPESPPPLLSDNAPYHCSFSIVLTEALKQETQRGKWNVCLTIFFFYTEIDQ